MNEHSETPPDWETQRNRIIGLGETSHRKSYYPELQQRILELEEKNRELQETYGQQTAVEEELRQQFDVTSKKEQELLVNEERLIMSQEIGHSGSWEYSFETNQIWGSAEALRIYGFPPTPGYYLLEEIEACVEDQEEVRQAFVDFINGRREYDIEIIVNPLDGSSQRVVRSIGRLEKDEKGEPIRVIGVLQDITQGKLAENALRESEERFRQIFENSPLGMTLVAPDLRFFSVNPAWVSMTGYSAEELLKMTFADITHPDNLSDDRKHIQELVAGTIPVYKTEKKYIRKDGSILWGSVRVTTIRNQQGTLRFLAAQIEDITERKKTETYIRESRDYLNTLFSSVKAGILVIDAKTHEILDTNPAAADMIGLPKEEIQGKICHRFICPAQKGSCPISDLGNFMDNSERVLLTSGGKTLAIIKYVVPITIHGRDCLLETFIDNTDRKRAEESLRESEERFRNLIEAAPVPITLSREGVFIYANSAFCRMTGYDCPHDVAGKNLVDFVAPESRQKVAGYVAERLRGEHPEKHYEAIGLRSDGTRFPYEITIEVIEQSSGPVTMAFITDITERKRAVDLIARSDARLRRAELVAGLGHWEFDLKAGYMYGSEGSSLLYGLPNLPWKIQDVQTIPLPEYRLILNEALRALIEDNRQYDVEFRIRRPTDGKVLDIHSIAEYDPKARVVFGVIQDITGRKRAEEALGESEKKYRNIVETTPDLIWEIDAQGNFTYLSPQVLGVLGYRAEDLMGKPFFVLLPPDQISAAKKVFENQFSESPPLITIEVIARHADGHLMDMEIRSAKVTDERGKLIGFRGITRDISERKEAAAALQISGERYRSLVAITDTGYLVLDNRGLVIDANEVYLRLTGRRSLADLIGRPVTEWTASYDLERNAREVEKCLATGQIRGLEIDYVKPDGTIQPVEINATVFHTREGDVILTLSRDISDRKRTNVALQQARNKLSLLNAVTFQDIQTAAFSLSAYQELIKTVLTDAKAKSYIDKQELFLKKMVDTLDFARNYQEMGIHHPRWQNVRQVFLYAISHLDFLHMKQNLQLENLEIFADPLFEKALFNIMENVLSHGVKATEVTLRYEETPDHITFIIEDNGVGIPPEEKNMIFDRGYGKGTGLGLFLVREVFSITGMTIRETGTNGKGTRFEITVPKGMYRFAG